ncbi:MAG: peptide chain release factor N(5)-glutamine methyltransferase [Vicinamibacteria bacterium]
MRAADALERAALRLAAAGVEGARPDAELLLRHVRGWDAAGLILGMREALPDDDRAAFEELVAARARRVPLQHLTGEQAFWRHVFRVTPDVLIPRPETEILVEAALEAVRGVAAPRIVDVGTGSGCIALSLAAERPDATVHAVDLSPAALAVARDNARRLGLADRVRFHEGDLLAPVAAEPRFDLVVSNPPYVGEGEIPSLAPEVRDHEPRMALTPPGERASMYGRLASAAAAHLAPAGALIVEIGSGMTEEVVQALSGAQLSVRRVLPDLQGIDRILVAARMQR